MKKIVLTAALMILSTFSAIAEESSFELNSCTILVKKKAETVQCDNHYLYQLRDGSLACRNSIKEAPSTLFGEMPVRKNKKGQCIFPYKQPVLQA